VEKAPTESYADVGGLEQQIQEIKEAVELPMTHPELYEDIGIKPPKVGRLAAAAGQLPQRVWGCAWDVLRSPRE
jgi:SpoVK/Ycf46/Vps4 family AAA+-type ATPase